MRVFAVFLLPSQKICIIMKRKEYTSTVVAGYKKCSAANFAPACFVVDVYFM